MSFLLFYSLGLISNNLPYKIQKITALIISFLLTLLLISHFFIYREFGDSFSYSMLNFTAENPLYLISFLKTYLLNSKILLAIILFLFYYWVWFPRIDIEREPKSLIKISTTFISIFLLYFFIVPLLSFDVLERKLSPDIALTFACYNYVKDNADEDKKQWLHGSKREIPEHLSPTNKNKFNVLLIINESWGKNGVWLYNGQNNCMPNLKKWIESENDNFSIFDHAFSNASATAISVPSILTGVAPWESSQKLHSMPFLWDWAKSLNYNTIFVSSQYYKWANFDNFFFSPGPDFRYTADKTEFKQANDFGVDDISMIQYFEEGIKKDTSNVFFAILQTNALHSPFQQKSDSIMQQFDFPSPYENSLFILDAYFQRIKTILSKYNKLENTIIIFTADHGDSDKLIHKPGRIVSFYDEVISIPFIVYTPKIWNKENSKFKNNLQKNTKINISNIDIAPTVANLFGFSNENKLYKQFLGKSLFDKIDSTRVFYALNTNETRTWREEGFAIINQDYRLIYSLAEGKMFYNTKNDSNQLKNCYNRLNASEINFYNEHILNNKELKRIQKRIIEN